MMRFHGWPSIICTLNLHDNCKFSLALDLNVLKDAPLTDLEEMFDPPLTLSPIVSPSFLNTPTDTSVNDLPLLTSLLPSAQFMSLEMGEFCRRGASVLEDDSLDRFKEFILVVSYVEEAPFEQFCGDIVMGTHTLSIGHIESVCTEPLNLIPTSSPFTSHHPFP